ncbi:replication/maintenance protein RepL [Campylobacter pinnipediorum]|uniref:ArsR family transcriptional regulator n=1 Tax=Campylobacter pinnipediorum subsp. pinnipediorum TaxID=1660067 RepID=A0AAX0LCH4_9BACT|nr:replication/maintenance protein RepL [Campylobacter pinnipediorum]OPA81754.1 ArsR family transcriptional regulator [Campylobacter pinnipediorum subsp. pinnipediorum]
MNDIEKGIFSAIHGEKKIQIIDFLIQNIGEHGFINLKIDEICKATNTSKPTVLQTFKLLENAKVFKKIKNGVYELKTF